MKSDFLFSSFGFLRTAAVIPELRVADPDYNSQKIIEAIRMVAIQGTEIILFPELCITGYTCGDLFYQKILQDKVVENLREILECTKEEKTSVVVGLPLLVNNRMYNCAAFLSHGNLCGIVPKTYIPTTNEYYEKRWFTSGNICLEDSLFLFGNSIPFGSDLIFSDLSFPGFSIGIEICEDLWAVSPPSADLAIAGATILLNLSASNEVLGKVKYRQELVKQQSARCLACYMYASSGSGESSTDLIFSGHALIAENGHILAESERFHFDTQYILADIDIQKIVHDRTKNCCFSSCLPVKKYRVIQCQISAKTNYHISELKIPLTKTPFIPSNPLDRSENCQEIFMIQSIGLAKRLRYIGTHHAIIGISGGLDSTLALLVTIRAFKILNLPIKGIIAILMPGFGSTSRTFTNAKKLSAVFGVTTRIIDIKKSVHQHFLDIDHENSIHDITYENAQARERTQILMDIANQEQGIVIGTGDLSELALGWCTYNGDQMSMYNINAGVPKTLVRYLIIWYADYYQNDEIREILNDINDTPISPELLPPSEDDKITQITEATIGSFELHDFFLYYMIRYHFSPKKIFYLAYTAFGDEYSKTYIYETMKIFYTRFFSNQYKRSAMPDGPKIGSISLSPRGDWRMPSDAVHSIWLKEIEELYESKCV